jgi:uncharacterized protein
VGFSAEARSGIQDSVRLLFDVLHPAHVHFFRHLIGELAGKGHEVKITLQANDLARDLLDEYGFAYEVVSRPGRDARPSAFQAVERAGRVWQSTARFRPHFMLGCQGSAVAQLGRLRRLVARDSSRVLVFHDDELASLENTLTYPLADYVCTADCYYGRVRGHHLGYRSYEQLAYLHPQRFTPDRDVVRRLGVDPGSRYFVVRFAAHRDPAACLPLERRVALVRGLSEHGRVVLSSETRPPPELAPYALELPAGALHHVIAFSSLLVGESAVTASEAACLGVPAVYVSPRGRGYTDEQERRYGLVQNFTEKRFSADWISAARELAADRELKARLRPSAERLWTEKLDLTRWMLELVEREYERHFAQARSSSATLTSSHWRC